LLNAPTGAGNPPGCRCRSSKREHRGKIILLEPRRLAARNVAQRLAELLNEKPGETVGYRMRAETCVGPTTRLEVVTEGILTRMLQNDPELTGVGLVILDEFHERSLQADLALALLLDVQQGLRDDLKLLIMSATLDNERLQRLLPDAPVIALKGARFRLSAAISRFPPISVLTKRSPLPPRSCCARNRARCCCFCPAWGDPARAGAAGPAWRRCAALPAVRRAVAGEQRKAILPAPAGSAKWCWQPILPRPV
jgi:ATP-dependent helicase HrpB